MDELLNLVASFVNPTQAELDALFAHVHKRRFRKGAFLLEAGEVCSHLVVLQEGITRVFRDVEGLEVSVWFSFAGEIGTDIQSFVSQHPSQFFVEALEDCQAWVISHQDLEELCAHHPVWNQWLRRVWGETIVYMIDRLLAFQHQTAEQRYEALMSDPTYLQRIPQKYLASYLGITPTSLSRLRRQIR